MTEQIHQFVDDQTGNVVDTFSEAGVTAVNSGNPRLQLDEAHLNRVSDVVKDVIEVSRSRGFDPTIALHHDSRIHRGNAPAEFDPRHTNAERSVKVRNVIGLLRGADPAP